jgi:hypothetical protein
VSEVIGDLDDGRGAERQIVEMIVGTCGDGPAHNRGKGDKSCNNSRLVGIPGGCAGGASPRTPEMVQTLGFHRLNESLDGRAGFAPGP